MKTQSKYSLLINTGSTRKSRNKKKPLQFGFSLLITILIVVVGVISFIYTDGVALVYRSWMSLVTPDIQFNILPENIIIPANGTNQIYIDVQLKDSHDQLLSGDEINVISLNGQIDITPASVPPADISKRFLLRAPGQPQLINLSFSYRHLAKVIAIEAFDPTPPLPPVITSPATAAILNTANPTVAGEAPIGTKTEIYVDAILNSTLTVDSSGKFSGSLDQAIKNGKHKLTSITINKYGIRSLASPVINIEVTTPDPEIDLANLRIKPNPVKALSSFQIFIPASANTQAVSLLLDNMAYPLQDADKSSIFSGVIPAPKNSGTYHLSLLITAQTGDSILVEKVASIQVN